MATLAALPWLFPVFLVQQKPWKTAQGFGKGKGKGQADIVPWTPFFWGFDFTPAWPIRISPSFQVVSGCRHETVGTIIRILAIIRNHDKFH